MPTSAMCMRSIQAVWRSPCDAFTDASVSPHPEVRNPSDAKTRTVIIDFILCRTLRPGAAALAAVASADLFGPFSFKQCDERLGFLLIQDAPGDMKRNAADDDLDMTFGLLESGQGGP